MAQRLVRLVLVSLGGLLLMLNLSVVTAQEPKSPVAIDGPYQNGTRTYKIEDPHQKDRMLTLRVFYPAQVKKDVKPPYEPDTSGGPYPLIIFSHGYTGTVFDALPDIKHLVSQGYVVAGVEHKDTDDVQLTLISRPLDVLLLLNTLADLKDDPLTGVIDTNNVGVMGFSFGGWTTLAVGGAQVNPQHFVDWCAGKSIGDNFDNCTLLDQWDNLLAYHKQFDAPSSGAKWESQTDKRIHALFSIAPCFGQFYDAEGLGAVQIPTVLVSGKADTLCPYELDANYYYQHLGSSDRYLISLDTTDHFNTFLRNDIMQHYASAFFGRYLLGKTEYAEYLTPESAKAFKDATLEARLESS